MTLEKFQQLDPRSQVTIALLRGLRLARRIGPNGAVNLYHIADIGRGFFVEVGHDEQQCRAVVRNSFRDYQPLDPYTDMMYLGLSFD